METFELFSYPTSLYSQKAQYALRAKGVKYSLRNLDLVSREHLQPWYMRINPMGEVPTLKHGDKYIPDSSAIINYLDENCDGPKLLPNKTAKDLHEKIHSVKIPTIYFGTMYHDDLVKTTRMDQARRDMIRKYMKKSGVKDLLEKLMAENQDLKDPYMKKIESIADPDVAFTKENVERAKEEVLSVFAEVEQQLEKIDSENQGKASWLFGSQITAPDAGMLMALFRLYNLGLEKELWVGKFPKIERYFDFAKENFPGFKEISATGF